MIKKIFLGFFLLLILVGGYFYFFPMYPDYGISDEYFYTRHYDKDFDSEENGFKEWQKLLIYLDDNSEFFGRLNAFYRCKEDFCNEIILEECISKGSCKQDTQEEQKIYVNSYLKKDFILSGDQQKLDTIINDYLKFLSSVNDKNFILTLDKKNYSQNNGGLFNDSTLPSTGFIRLNTLIGYRALEYSEKNKFAVYSSNYKGIIGIMNKLDASFLDYLVIQTVINNQTLLIKRDYASSKYGLIWRDIINTNKIQKGFVENAIKRNYQLGLLILEDDGIINFKKYSTFSMFDDIPRAILRGMTPEFLFYSKTDTINLMKRAGELQILSKTITPEINQFHYNGRNLLGRWSINNTIDDNDFSSQFQKEQKLVDTQSELLQLLSN